MVEFARPFLANSTLAVKRKHDALVVEIDVSSSDGEDVELLSSTRPFFGGDLQVTRDEAFARSLQAEELHGMGASISGYDADLALAQRLQQEEEANIEPRPTPAVAAVPSTDCLALKGVSPCSRIEALPWEPRSMPVPKFQVWGTPERRPPRCREELVAHFQNVDGCQGRLIAGCVLHEVLRQGFAVPAPGRILIDWHRSRRSKTPWRTGLRVRSLEGCAERLLTLMREDQALVARFPKQLNHDRGFNDTEVVVADSGKGVGPHTDVQPDGSLLFIFAAGLTSASRAWPGDEQVDVRLESGDVMVFDGGRTLHAVPKVFARTSPFPGDPWLGTRRLVALVRERSL
eukprot:TRINITY_DN15247_c0_g1_i1.p1 TRINITY_DN15247_c0_g1~~TRINITY_DN15247_c0_g1_i1.p1  ORF type:complete len:345 (-),score=54.79 TRINITY_DN15247_c0_g1_i1:396-1430(-)